MKKNNELKETKAMRKERIEFTQNGATLKVRKVESKKSKSKKRHNVKQETQKEIENV